MSNLSQTLTSAFIDLATFDELEKYMYGGDQSTTYFVAQIKTSTWFSLCPTVLNKNMGQADFGQDWAASISRAGDYLLHVWLRADFPSVKAVNPGDQIRWTHNVAHNLIRLAGIAFNDLTAQQFDSTFLDFWAAFTVPASKQVGYNNMIGNTELQYVCSNILPAFTVNLPLPFFFTRDSGVGLPTAALPYNDMRISIQMRSALDLLVLYPNNGGGATQPTAAQVQTAAGGSTISLTSCNLWAEYAIVSNDERKRMGCAPRDILIEQVQTAPRNSLKAPTLPGQYMSNPTDIRFSHAVKTLFFGARNRTVNSEWSNYTFGPVDSTGYVAKLDRIDPVGNATLLYENTQRLASLPADYYALVEPWYKAPSIPYQTGYHMYSYSLALYDLDPKGSTNYGKLTNVTLDMQLTSQPGSVTATQILEGVILAVNNNVIRISGGALGFPVL